MYQFNIKIPNYICDQYDTLSMWGLARIFQEAADKHASMEGVGFSQLKQDNKAWVLIRVYYKIDRLPNEGEEVTAKTWSRGNDGLFAFREYTLTDPDGNLLVSSTSYWAIIDLLQRKAVRLHNLMNNFKDITDLATDRATLDRVRIPKQDEEPLPVAEFPVKPSMLDHNGHVNNAEYIKWVFDNLNTETLKDIHRNFRFTIEYFQETPPNDTVSVFRIPTDNSTYFKISNSRSVAVKAVIEQ